MQEQQLPVFLDLSGRRALRFKRLLTIAVLLITGGAGLFALGLFQDPRFPAIQMATQTLLQQAERSQEVGLPGTLLKTTYEGQSDDDYPEVLTNAPPTIASGRPPVVFGFYVPWNKSSLNSLRANYRHLTHVLAEWMIVANSEGDVLDVVEPDVVEWARQVNVPILLMVTNYRENDWRSDDLHRILRSTDRRRRLVANITGAVAKYRLGGVNIDFEQVPVEDRAQFTAFMQELHDVLAPQGLLLTQDLPTDDDNVAAFDMARLAELNNYVIPMAYDQHYPASLPGPVASQAWFRHQLREIRKILPPQKVVVGLGNYGYDWTLGTTRDAVTVSFEDVISLANQYEAPIGWYGKSQNPFLRYRKAGLDHEVWFLDAITALNEVRAVHDGGFAGVSFWRLGSEDPGLWEVLENGTWPAKDFAVDSLGPLRPIEGVRQYGSGEAIRVTQTRSAGWRRVSLTATGDYQETFERHPTGDVVVTVGQSQQKVLTLTFDDGPDPVYTPQILDILKQKNVPAAFFVLGGLAKNTPVLLRRMYDEGHIIGNHTYSHGERVAISPEILRLELNLTQRIVENAVGRSMTLFRPPYNTDSEPRTPEAVERVLVPQRFGYTTLAARVDPRDWETTSTEAILRILAAEKDLGHVVVLHDGGGDRTPTIQALPVLIDMYRAQGYRFVNLETLLGKSRDELMPVPVHIERNWATFIGGMVAIKDRATEAIQWVFLGAICLTGVRTLVFSFLSVSQKRRARRQRFDPTFDPLVSVIIAAHNEAKMIVNTVSAVLASSYPKLEVILVDDGSTDATHAVMAQAFGNDARVRIFTQPNGGKASALNRAIRHATNGIIVALDADTLLAPQTIGKLVRHFEDPRVAAVSGNVKVGNGHRWITRLQSIEYVCGFNLDRRALDVLNAAAVVPGAVGAWRTKAVLEAGGYSNDTVAEDTDLTLALRRRGYLIKYDEEAIAYTEAPETVGALARQRLRWSFGTLQSAWKHRDVTFRRRYGSMAFVTLPTIWLSQLMFAAISPFAEVAMVVALVGGNARAVLLYYVAFLIVEFIASLLAYRLESEHAGNLRWLLLQRLLYPRMMCYVVTKSVVRALTGRPQPWGHSVRYGTTALSGQSYTRVQA